MNYKLKDIALFVKKFVRPFYCDKDIMHDLSHIEKIRHKLDDLTKVTNLNFNKELTAAALYFHGIIYSHETKI